VTPDLIIVGASVRAAAASAIRAGYMPWCIDLFADADLQAMVADVHRCPFADYPRRLPDFLSGAPAAPWMYTGALENHPRLVGEMAEISPLWGNGPDALRASRSPFNVQRILKERGLRVPALLKHSDEVPAGSCWLRKSLSGSAGQGISFADHDRQPSTHCYYQQFVAGDSMSAVFSRNGNEVSLIGVTEQLIGTPWLNAPPFRYAGNVGPIPVSESLRRDLQLAGEAIGSECNLRGLFGIDFILADARPWVVEVNPRYTASIEVLERATGLASLSLHSKAFGDVREPRDGDPSRQPVCAKGILYANRSFAMPAYDLTEMLARNFADLPAPNEIVEEGWPILTVHAEGSSRDECMRILAGEVEHIKRVLN
jgi:predicted ATP-grasp superfamily ATP-dependent carboligase